MSFGSELDVFDRAASAFVDQRGDLFPCLDVPQRDISTCSSNCDMCVVWTERERLCAAFEQGTCLACFEVENKRLARDGKRDIFS